MNTNTIEPTFPLIEVSGTSYEMGYQHGIQARQLVRNYLKWIEKMTGEPRESLCNCAMAFLPTFEKLSAALVDETRGLAKGADISLEEALLCQTRYVDDFTGPVLYPASPHIPRRSGTEGAEAHGGGCTAFAITGSATADGNTLIGQNEDMQPEVSDITTLLHVKPSDGRPRALMVTPAGQLGHQGMNEYGVAHLINGLSGLDDHEFRQDIFRYPLNRIMLEKRTVEECVNLLAKYRDCSAVNKVICDGQGSITDVEVRPEGIAIFSDDHPHWRIHTNHYLTPQFMPYATNWASSSKPRLERMRYLIKEQWGKITLDTMKAILADHEGDPAGICRHGGGYTHPHSIVGYIAEPAKGLFHVRKGHGCIGTWQVYKV